MGFLVILIEKGVGTGKSSRELSVVTCLPIFDLKDFNLRREDIIHFLAIHPAEALIFLDTFFGDIFSADALGIGDNVVVSVHGNHLSLRSLNFEPRGEMSVIWKFAI